MMEAMSGRLPKLALVIATLGALGLVCPVARAQSAGDTDNGGWFDDTTTPAAGSDAASAQTLQSAAPQSSANTYGDTDPRALTDFRATLSPYGRWVQDPTYGLVWVPDPGAVGADFAPYVSSGHWAVTPGGDWTWVSDYPFGWVVFHYGRWVWINGTGWAWIAGREYSNAWVEWRVPDDGYDYVGWAPLPPAWGWWDGVAVSLWFTPPAAYVFCPSAYVFDYDVPRYIVHDRRDVWRIAHHSRRYRDRFGRVIHHGPAFSRAHVPARVVPRRRTPADPRAIAASRPTGASGAPRAWSGGSPAPASFSARTVSSHSFSARTLRGTSVPRSPPVPHRASRARPVPLRTVSARSLEIAPRRYYRSTRLPSRARFYAPRSFAGSRPAYVRAPHFAPSRSFHSSEFRFAPHYAPVRMHSYAPSRSYVPARGVAPARAHFGGFRGGVVHAVRGRR